MSSAQDREYGTYTDPDNDETVLSVIAGVDGLIPGVEHFNHWPRHPNDQNEENGVS
jgi:hypothetical protein